MSANVKLGLPGPPVIYTPNVPIWIQTPGGTWVPAGVTDPTGVVTIPNGVDLPVQIWVNPPSSQYCRPEYMPIGPIQVDGDVVIMMSPNLEFFPLPQP
jgi:hypothetical protein